MRLGLYNSGLFYGRMVIGPNSQPERSLASTYRCWRGGTEPQFCVFNKMLLFKSLLGNEYYIDFSKGEHYLCDREGESSEVRWFRGGRE